MSLKKLKIEFIDNSVEIQAQHLCFLAKSIALGDFAKEGYIVLPYLANGEKKAVFFPDIKLPKGFWRLLNDCPNRDLGKSYPKELLEIVGKQLESPRKINLLSGGLAQNDKSWVIENWNKVQNKFFSYCDQFLRFSTNIYDLSFVRIVVSDYGTAGSYDIVKSEGKYFLYLIVRSDFNLDNLIRIILMALWTLDTRKRTEIGEYYWKSKMAIIDFIFSQTVFADLIKPYLTKHRARPLDIMMADSAKYLTSLGLGTDIGIKIAEEKIYINNKLVSNLFSVQEENLLKLFIKNAGNVVTYDQIGECLWGDESYDKYSQFSISKVVENIRRKLLNLGLNKEIIVSVRKRGYLLSTIWA